MRSCKSMPCYSLDLVPLCSVLSNGAKLVSMEFGKDAVNNELEGLASNAKNALVVMRSSQLPSVRARSAFVFARLKVSEMGKAINKRRPARQHGRRARAEGLREGRRPERGWCRAGG